MMPLVSVIIPNYNHAPYLKQRIESVLNQTYQDFEVIILDDCSTDNSRDIIEHYKTNSKIKNIIYNRQNSGSTFKQWDKGIAEATGDYIWIAESDDYCETDFIEKIIGEINNDAEIVLAYTQSKIVDENNIETLYLGDSIVPNHNKVINYSLSYNRSGFKEITSLLYHFNYIYNASSVIFKKKLIFVHY